MAHAKHTMSFVSFFALILFTQCFKTISAGASAPAPTPTEEAASPTPAPVTILTSGPTADSPIPTSELLELSLPEIGIQKAAIPQSEGAKVANKQLEGIEHKIEEFKAVITKRQAGPGSEESKQCLEQCQENLEYAIDGVKISIESINDIDLEKANVDIAGIASDVETCNDCFVELGSVDKDIKAFTDWVKGVTKECLNNLKKA